MEDYYPGVLCMYIYPKIEQHPIPLNPINPTDYERHELLYRSLVKVGRPEDYRNIVRLLLPPKLPGNHKPGEFKDTKVGIIGGGLAGMSAAFELRRLGFDITIFEPNNERIGGRVYTYYFDRDKRLYGEFGAMRIPVSHETVWHYINLFKLKTEPFIQSDPNTFTHVRDMRVRNDSKGQNIFHNIYPMFDLTTVEANIPWPQLYNQVTKYFMSTIPTDIRKQFLTKMEGYDYRYSFVQNISIRQALQMYGLSDEAINLIISLMPIMGSTINSSFETTLNDDYTMDFINLYSISGGMVNLPMAFYKSLTSSNPAEYSEIPLELLGKVDWRGGYVVYGIYKSDINGKVALKYNLAPPSHDYPDLFETFDYVICAFPMSILRIMDLRPLFSGRKMEAIRDVVYFDAQKTLFLCSERFWEKQGIFGGSSYTDRINEIISYPSDHAFHHHNNAPYPYNEPGVLLASYNTGQDATRLGNTTSANLYRFIRENVEEVHGLPKGYLDSLVIDVKTIDWDKEIFAKGAFQMLLPGQKSDFLYVSATPEYNNRVFFAGEHTSVKNAWIQGALHSGVSAASEVAYYAAIHKYQK